MGHTLKTPGPRLAQLIADGHAHIDGFIVVGVASDGVECSLGSTDTFDRVETYLADFPTPDMW